MAVANRNLSQVKLDIQQIFSNLEILENRNNIDSNLERIKSDTEHLLKNLEELPLEHYKAKITKLQTARRKRKLQKIINLEVNKNLNLQTKNLESKVCSVGKSLRESHKRKQKFGQHRKTIKECQRFLKAFELLQQLHLLRGQNPSDTYKFSLKLRQLKTIWNSLLQDNLQEQISNEVKIQDQWNELLFGPLETTYFVEKPNIHDFVRKRQVWDSYIDGRYGSSIPIGWVIPPSEANEQWLTHLAPSL
ncbi:hypothetical protein DOY81_002224 [Sarcophaga bullata]|nr:hypothetical protein DOY81_002224 [Sarcophaga bullata]